MKTMDCPFCGVAGLSPRAFLFHKTRCLKAPPDAWKKSEERIEKSEKGPVDSRTDRANKPTLALSIRQPWAWLIVRGYKDVENRTWKTMFFGRIWVHAGKGMTADEYEACADVCAPLGVLLPRKDLLLRGGIIGSVTLVECVEKSTSPWFVGPFGFVLRDPQECDFVECPGQLNFWQPPATIFQPLRGGVNGKGARQ